MDGLCCPHKFGDALISVSSWKNVINLSRSPVRVAAPVDNGGRRYERRHGKKAIPVIFVRGLSRLPGV
jgi:hypothetical protein